MPKLDFSQQATPASTLDFSGGAEPVEKVSPLAMLGRQFVAGGGDVINFANLLRRAVDPAAGITSALTGTHDPVDLQAKAAAARAQEFGDLAPNEVADGLAGTVAGGVGRVIPNLAAVFATGGGASLESLVPAAIAKVPVLGRVALALGRGAPTAAAMTTEQSANLPDNLTPLQQVEATGKNAAINLALAGVPVAVGSGPLVRTATGGALGAAIPAGTASLSGQPQDVASNIVGGLTGALLAQGGGRMRGEPLDPFLDAYTRSAGEAAPAPAAPLALPRGADFSAKAEPVRPLPVDLGGAVRVDPAGTAATPAQGANAFAQAVASRMQPTAPGLPEPVVTVDRAGNAATSADQNVELSQIQQAIARQQQAAAERQALGITPDIERSQGVRWSKQQQAAAVEAERQARLDELDQSIAEREAQNVMARGHNARPDETVDDALTFLAKKGGLDRRTFIKEGLDPAAAKAMENRTRGGASRPLFRAQDKGGMSLDHAAEALWQHGYLPDQDNNAALDMILSGVNQDTKAYSIHRQDQGDLLALQQARNDAAMHPSDDFADVPFSFAGERPRESVHANNASGESAASLEAINRQRDEQAQGRTRALIDRYGNVEPLVGADAVDAKARDGQVIVQRGIGREPWTMLDHGGDISPTVAQGKVNRARSELDALAERSAPVSAEAVAFKPRTPQSARSVADGRDADAAEPRPADAQDTQAIAKYNAVLSRYIGAPVRFTPTAHVPEPDARALAEADKVFGGRSILVDNATPEALDINGVTLRDGTRLINSDATSPAVHVAFHEISHQMKADAPDLFAELEAEMDRQGALDKYQRVLSERAARNGEDPARISDDLSREELVSDAIGDAMADPVFLEHLAQRNPGLFQRLGNYIMASLKALTRKLRDLGSREFLSDVEAFRTKLSDVMERYAERQQAKREPMAAREDATLSRKPAADQTDTTDGELSPAFSRKPDYTPEQREFMRKAGMSEVVDERTAIRRALDGLQGKRPHIDGDAFRQGAIDQFHGLKRAVDEKGGIAPENDPHLAAEMIQTASTMEAILRFGAPELHNGALRVNRGVPGLLDALAPVHDTMPQWLGWMVAGRAKLLQAQGRENAMSAADIQAGLSLAKGHEAAFKQAAAGYVKLKNAILDLAEQTGIIDPVARQAWDHAEYIPFYRDMDAGASGPGTRQGLANQSSGIRTLKGGEAPLKDPLGNIIANFTRLVDASMKNRAVALAVDQLGAPYFRKAALEMKAETIPMDQVKRHLLAQGVDAATIAGMPPPALRGVGRMLAVKAPEGDDIVRVMRAGKAEYYHVDDPLLLRSLTAFHEGSDHLAVKVLAWFKNLLTAGATGTPDFLIRNAIRDTGEASMTSRDRFLPLVDTVRGAIDSFRETPLAQDLMMAGAAFHGGLFHTGNNEDTAKAIRRALRQHGLTDSAMTRYVKTLINPLRLWDIYRSIAESTEMGSRVSLARLRLKAGASDVEAAHEAKDFLNFQRRGDDKFVQAFTKVIPFLNARVQGADRLYRTGTTKGRRGKVLRRLAYLATLSTLLYWWNTEHYKDAYDELPDWDKDANWHIAPGTPEHLRIPKPFELGLVGGTLPERMYGALRYQLTGGEEGDRGKQSWNAFLRGIWNALGLNPVPQAVMPIAEEVANKNFYFGSKIEGMGDQYKVPSDRYGPTTSRTMRAASKGMAAVVGEDYTLSPKRLEHLWTGYTAGMGQYLLDGTDWVTQKATGAPDTPAWALRDYPFIGTVARGGGPPRTTRYVDEFYDLADQARMRSKQVKDAVHTKDAARAQRLEKEWGWLIGERQASGRAKEGFMNAGVREFNKVSAKLSAISKANAVIYADTTMTGQQKRDALDANLVKRNALVRTFVRQVRARQRKAGK